MEARVEVRATEDEKKVREAIENLFDGVEAQKFEGGWRISGEGREILEKLKEMVWAKRILDSVRRELLRSEVGGEVTLQLNKQAAFAGKFALSGEGESPLGPILISFLAEDVDWFSPKTKNGEPI